MKKSVLFIISIITIVMSLLVVNFFKTRENTRIVDMGKSYNFIDFSVESPGISNEDFLNELKNLSKKYNVSFMKTDYGAKITKAIILDKDTFDYDSFNLSDIDFGHDLEDVYSSEMDKNSDYYIPIFLNAGDIDLISLDRYVRDGNTISGNYTIISTSDYDREGLLKDLEDFLNTDRETLLAKRVGVGFSFVNRYMLIYILLIAISIVLLILISVYTPFNYLKEIGVEKMLGFPDKDILLNYVKLNVIAIVAISIIFDIGIYFYIDYIPDSFFNVLILAQLFVLLLYLFISYFVYIFISKITVSNMLKNFQGFNFIIYINIILKVMITGIIMLVLFQTSLVNKELAEFTDFRNIIPKEELDYITVDTLLESSRLFNSPPKEYSAFYKNVYEDLNTKTPLKYIFYHETSPLDVEDKYDILALNDRSLIELGLSPSDKENVYYVPIDLEDDDIVNELKKKYIERFYSFDDNIPDAEDININIERYESADIDILMPDLTVSHVHNPIIYSVDNQMLYIDMYLLSITSYQSPIRVKFSRENLEALNEVMSKYRADLTYNFATIASISNDHVTFTKNVLYFVYSVFFIFMLLNFVVTFFIIQSIYIAKSQYLSVTRILGFKRYDRFRDILMIILIIDIIAIIALTILTKSIFPIIAYVIYTLMDVLLIYVFSYLKDKKSIVLELKGAS